MHELAASVYARRVHDDFSSGVRSGTSQTPTFFINGVQYNGALDLDELLETLEEVAVAIEMGSGRNF